MAKSFVATTSGAIKGSTGTGKLYQVNVTKVGTGASSITIYDNTAGSGTILFQGDGLSQACFNMTGENGSGVQLSTGLFIALAGTTNPTVVVSYD